eukprot:TRINITY_DN13430_c0_g1_i1.p1 TRINITY_DN13430_c0_g1~~TRINITY_DN13430_c0_g1_i1.p1  ORF type:complete len:102 (-),score=15.03 TRINITY_DN13430_c0_g1_i1:121-426(-)
MEHGDSNSIKFYCIKKSLGLCGNTVEGVECRKRHQSLCKEEEMEWRKQTMENTCEDHCKHYDGARNNCKKKIINCHKKCLSYNCKIRAIDKCNSEGMEGRR